MTDFLTSLVARTLAPPALAPRLRSRFEPLAFDDGAISETGREIDIDALARPTPSLVGAPEAAGAPAPDKKAARVPPGIRESGPPSPREPEAHGALPVLRPVSEGESLAIQQQPAAALHAGRAAQPERSGGPGRQTAGSQAVETVSALSQQGEIRIETQGETHREIDREASRETSHEAHRDTNRETPDEAREPARTAERARTIATRVLERSEITRVFGQQPHAAREEAVSEPSIQISIGRVEVRGVAPAAVPSRAAKPSPVLSLDGYLDRRNRKDGR